MPVITVTGLQIGNLIAFALVTETVFQWPGMGFLFIQAVTFVDIPVMAAYLIVVSFIFVSLNTIVDLLYAVVDPRLRSDADREAPRMAAEALSSHRRRGSRGCSTATSAGASAARPVAVGSRRSFSLLIVADRARSRRWIAPQNPYDLTQLFLDKAETAADLAVRRRMAVPARHRSAGPRRAVGDPLRLARLARRSGSPACCLAMTIGVTRRAYRRLLSADGIDNLLMRIGDTVLSIPTLLVAILVSAIFRELLPPALREAFAAAILVLSISLTSWVQYARIVRASTMVERRKEYVLAARIIGVAAGPHHAPAHPAEHADARCWSRRRSTSASPSCPRRRCRSSASACR